MTGSSRRRFCQGALAALAIGPTGLANLSAGEALPRILLPEDASRLIPGKDKRLIVLKNSPAVFETPLELLKGQKTTPSELLFVRNNQQPKSMEHMKPVDANDWSIRISGLLNRNVSVTYQQLKELPQTTVEMVLQCSGNGRALFSKAAETKGTQWGRGGFGCVQFGGVPIKSLFDHLKLEPLPNSQFVKAEGKDQPAEAAEDFLHSLPVNELMNRSMLAISLNGKPIPAIHGGPVRLITPGVYATMNIKWLGALTFERNETENYNQVPRYRVPNRRIRPGTKIDLTLENSRFNWGMKTKSIILSPSDRSECKSGVQTVEGVAFNDGSCKIQTVLISIDRGKTWQKAKLSHPQNPYAWTMFRAAISLAKGKQEIWSRAIDERGRSQPIDGSIAWNPRGYEWNGVDQITVQAD